MPQPTLALSGGLAIVKFGNQPLPNGQGTMSYVNLNDRQSWFCQALADLGYDNRQITLGQLVYRGRSTYLADDWGPWKFSIPFKYDENATYGGTSTPLGAALGQLLLSGEQMLTFDNATGVLCKVAKVGGRKMNFEAYPPLWSFDLQFVAKAGWFQDLSPTTYLNALALNSGSVTNTNVTYSGSVWAEPVWTLTIPAGNAAPIASFRLQNTMSGDDLTVTFPGNLPASTAATVTIDSGAFSVVDGNGITYDISGKSFPLLYGPTGQVQQISATLTPASGTATGCTLTCVASNRWLL
jgi:hypothetical protein